MERRCHHRGPLTRLPSAPRGQWLLVRNNVSSASAKAEAHRASETAGGQGHSGRGCGKASSIPRTFRTSGGVCFRTRRDMPTIKVDLPRVHMAGSDAHHDAHLEVGPQGFALFLSPDAEYPLLDIDGTPAQLDEMVRALGAALASRGVPSDRGRVRKGTARPTGTAIR